MIDRIIEMVPWWVFVFAALVAIAALAYATFFAGWLATWMFWALLGTLVVGGVVGLIQGRLGGGGL
jgi:hypothetical protein